MKYSENFNRFKDFCIERHNIYANQKYDNKFTYADSHLYFVVSQFNKFSRLLPSSNDSRTIALLGCYGHDLIEDARVTYNDIVDIIGEEVADVIYACTEEKGKNREERHSEKYYNELAQNEVAVFVKLCDIIANVTYSILTNSSMYNKHRKEHEKTWRYLYKKQYHDMFIYLDKLFNLK